MPGFLRTYDNLAPKAGAPSPPAHPALSASLPLLRIRVAFYREADPAWQVDEHDHDIHQWYLCVHGGLHVRVDGTVHELEAERSVIVPPKARRELLGLRRAPGYLVLIFDPCGLDVSSITGGMLALPGPLRDDLHALIDELRHPQEDHALLVRSLVLRLLIGHKRAATAPAAPTLPGDGQ